MAENDDPKRGKATKNEGVKTDYRKDKYLYLAKFGLKAVTKQKVPP